MSSNPSKVFNDLYFSDSDNDCDSDFDINNHDESNDEDDDNSEQMSVEGDSSHDMEASVEEEVLDAQSNMQVLSNDDEHSSNSEDLLIMDIGSIGDMGEDHSLSQPEDFDSEEDDAESLTIIDCFNIVHDQFIAQVSIKCIREAMLFFITCGLYHQVSYALHQLEKYGRLEQFMLAPNDNVSTFISTAPCI